MMTNREARHEIAEFLNMAFEKGKNGDFQEGVVRGMLYAYQTAGILSGREVVNMARDFLEEGE